MTNLFSAISGQFSKSLLLGTMLPVTVFVLLALGLVWPQVPTTVVLVEWAKGLDSEWKLAAVTLTVVLLTALLHTLNGPIIRFYEGYPWCDSWLGRWRIKRHIARLEGKKAQWRGLWTLLCAEEAEKQASYETAVEFWNRLARELNNEYPSDLSAVLPTRLGNVIRSFEDYSYRQYKIRSITMWPRLVAKIEEGYAAQLAEAKSSLDFMLNSSVLCTALAVMIATVRLIYPAGLASAGSLVPVLLQLTVLFLLAYGFYLTGILRAQAWGTLVKGAFDLFRFDLLATLGFKHRPTCLEEERDLWDWISNRLMLSDLTVDAAPPYEPAASLATVATAESGDISLEITRGAKRSGNGDLTITVRVHNPDPERPAIGVSVTENIPEGWLYEWDSIISSVEILSSTGQNPYSWRIGDLASKAHASLTYRILPVYDFAPTLPEGDAR